MSHPVLPVLAGIAPEVAYVRLPRGATLFDARALRLRALAEGHAARDWLLLLGRLCDAQHAAAGATSASSVVEATHGPPLSGVAWCDETWVKALERILGAVSEVPLPEAARDAVARLRGAGRDTWVAWASALRGEPGAGPGAGPDPALVPFLAAAMQVRAVSLAERLQASAIARVEADCPVCGAPALAGVVTGDEKVRYLSCSLCASAWHRVRVQCATCASPSGVSYYAIEGQEEGGVKAEACGECRTYLKLFYEERRPGIEPLADDAATIALDLLLGERDYARGGVNLLVAAG